VRLKPIRANRMAGTNQSGRSGRSLYNLPLICGLLQAPSLGELAEPFGRKQVGSSAMPFKRNSDQCRRILTVWPVLSQLCPVLPGITPLTPSWNGPLDDSANRREILPAAFLATDEILRRATRLVRICGWMEAALPEIWRKYGTFAATSESCWLRPKAGADRQEDARNHPRAQPGRLGRVGRRSGQSPARPSSTDARITQYLAPAEILGLLDAPNMSAMRRNEQENWQHRSERR